MANNTVQIPMELFSQLCRYHLCGQNTWEDDLNQPIERGLRDKLDKLIAHDLYTRYKNGATDQEREQARQEYLDHVGIPDDFRWEQLI